MLGDPGSCSASASSLRFAKVTVIAGCALGLALAVLAPLLAGRTWLIAPPMLPVMVAPA